MTPLLTVAACLGFAVFSLAAAIGAVIPDLPLKARLNAACGVFAAVGWVAAAISVIQQN